MNDDETRDGSDLFDPRIVMQINRTPIQRPGVDRHVRTAMVGGPELPGDRRVYLSADLLGRCLKVAKASPTGRVLLTHAGIRVDLYEDGTGHPYEVWTLVGYGPKPEPAPPWLQAIRGGA